MEIKANENILTQSRESS